MPFSHVPFSLPSAELVAQKVVSMVSRSLSAKGPSDLTDIRRLLLTFPGLKAAEGTVADRLRASGASDPVLDAWRAIAAQPIDPEDDEGGY